MNPSTRDLYVVDGRELGLVDWAIYPDDPALVSALEESFAVARYAALKATGFQTCFPAAVIHWLDVIQTERGHGHGSAILRRVIAAARQRGARTILLKAMYDSTPQWEAEREWKEKFYMRAGFTRYAADDIRPLMTLAL
jgi:GNAT superfamily N-acetyltransferase